MNKITLKSEKREVFGSKVKSLRKKGLVPANIFGKKIKSEAITLVTKDFIDVYKKAGETQVIDLNGKPVLISNVQVDPTTDSILHIDFRQVDLTEKIEAKIPVHLIGESPAEKQNMGTVVQQLNEVEVEALPADLPEKIEVSVDTLTEVDQAIYVKDLKLSKGVEIKTDLESIVVKVEPPQKEEEVAIPVTAVEGAESAASESGEGQAEDAPKSEEKGQEEK